ncbi:FtsX-like permease family protein [Clostridia bacterium OttesenSCG-928-F22]|nr:FtsX-like permease family protein [Clostridia bacterium OttesenSCG-928-F22]
MIVGIKDTKKLLSISIIVLCAVFVCTLFLNFNLDLIGIKNEINSEIAMQFYDAQVSTAKVVSIASGGCLLITSVIMLLFYIKNYIDTHRKELGILKALGYSNFKIAKSFWVFGLSIFAGAIIGFLSSFLLMPSFYEVQNADKILPAYSVHFHPSLALYLVILPSIAFALLSVLYACRKLKAPVMDLLKEQSQPVSIKKKIKKHKGSADLPFLAELKKNTLRSRKALIFFIAFASFCYSAMFQMSFSMRELASDMSAVMIMLIGIILACTTLLLAITTLVKANTKAIAMMRVFGYRQNQCSKALLSGYRPIAYIGFAIGTVYQYALLKIMVTVVFKDIANVPEYHFDFQTLLICLISFVVIYELIMYRYSRRISTISVKEIMLE